MHHILRQVKFRCPPVLLRSGPAARGASENVPDTGGSAQTSDGHGRPGRASGRGKCAGHRLVPPGFPEVSPLIANLRAGPAKPRGTDASAPVYEQSFPIHEFVCHPATSAIAGRVQFERGDAVRMSVAERGVGFVAVTKVERSVVAGGAVVLV